MTTIISALIPLSLSMLPCPVSQMSCPGSLSIIESIEIDSLFVCQTWPDVWYLDAFEILIPEEALPALIRAELDGGSVAAEYRVMLFDPDFQTLAVAPSKVAASISGVAGYFRLEVQGRHLDFPSAPPGTYHLRLDCSSETLLFSDGFESGSLDAWRVM